MIQPLAIGLPADYAVPAGAYDELRAADGSLRPAFAAALASPDLATADSLHGQWRTAEGLIRENGITFNVHADPRGLARPWPLDPLPLILEAEEWHRIEAGLCQRARLLAAVIRDVYGPRRIVRDGLVPPGVIFANPGFLRPCDGSITPDGADLHFMAVDLGRRRDGTWVVLADRAQAPSGAGYALENRTVISRSLTEAFRAQPVAPLGRFFTRFRETLERAAQAAARNSRSDSGEARVVLLAPGQSDEVYFEHAYLARQFGIPLVAGEDLLVRRDRVYLKTLGGLGPVDAILRRLDDDFCDPLWLQPGSTLGVAGLVGAERHGHIAICNRLGTGIAEAAALLPYLPGLARHLLGEDLVLPQADSWWLGDPDSRAAIGSEMDALIVKPAFPGLRLAPVIADGLDPAARRTLDARIAKRPGAFVAQHRIALSCAPCWQGEKLVPRPLVLRCFVALGPNGYIAMPGGLSRVGPRLGSPMVSIQWGGGSKDTWVIADGEAERPTMGKRPALVDEGAPNRAPASLPSRVADNLYWLGRYAERAEITLRLARALWARTVADLANSGGAAAPLLAESLNQLGVKVTLPASGAALAKTIQDALPDHLEALQRAAADVRDRLSHDTWRALSALTGPALRGAPGNLPARLDHLLGRLSSFSGHASENMTRGLGWRFLELGRRLERAYQTLELVRRLGNAEAEVESAALDALLDLCDSGMTYRARYQTGLRGAGIIDLVVSDEANPRAVGFQIATLVEHLRHLPRENPGALPAPELRLASQALAVCRRADPQRLTIATGGTPRRPRLEEHCLNLEADLAQISDILSEAYFKHAKATPLGAPIIGVA
jgi:uncharacterized circularly permuted ATP-grasp superfamily protein/uncharacterized alpha-E superfamily protein